MTTVMLCCAAPAALASAHDLALSAGWTSLPLPPGDWPRASEIARRFGVTTVLTDRPDAPELAGFDTRIGPEGWDGVAPLAPRNWPERATILLTGGSSGAPKPVDKTARSIRGEAELVGTLFGSRAPRMERVVSTVPPEHMFGYMFGFWLPRLSGLPVPAERLFLPADLRRACMAEDAPAWVVTTPAHLRGYVRLAERFENVAGLICATAPLEHDLALAACRAFSAPIVEIYGTTETGALAFRLRQAGDRAPARWTPLPGTTATPQPDGRTRWVQPHAGLTIDIEDRIDAHPDGSFELAGRSDDMVKVAGKRQSLAGLNQILTSLPGVRDGALVQRADDERLAALLVPEPGTGVEAILAGFAERVDAVFVPRPVFVLDALPRSETGKLRVPDLLAALERLEAARRMPELSDSL